MNPLERQPAAVPRRAAVFGLLPAAILLFAIHAPAQTRSIFRAGAFAIDITPTNYPVLVNAMFLERTATNAHDPLHARCLVLDDGTNRVAIAVVDTCMMARDLIDEAKELARQATGIPTDRMLISATHTHSAPSAMGCLGSRQDTNYARFLPGRIAEGIARAAKNLAPARVGWAVAQDYEHTFCRRWVRRPDRIEADPFGQRTVRANMHPGHQSKDVVGPSGPVDPDLSVLSLQSPDGRPLALLANYSMHYYESPLLSADYYGRFAREIARLVGAGGGDGPFVAIMSQGTSGDQMWMDYGRPRKQIGVDAYAREVAQAAFGAYTNIQYRDWAPLVMREKRLTLGFRLCDELRLDWAKKLVASMGDRLPRNLPEVYAKEQLYLRERPTAELKLQALRIGELGITAIPNEVFAITGLKIKRQSPLRPTFNVELANGAEGYIPPPEQHKLGGYTTWAARTAGLVPEAEPRIVETVLTLLEEVSGQRRQKLSEPPAPYSRSVLQSQPTAYWRLSELNGPRALDATGHGIVGAFEDGIAFFLPGPEAPGFSGASSPSSNRCAHFAGGRIKTTLPNFGPAYSVELWFWNGLPADARPVTGYLFSRGPDGDPDAGGDHLGIGGTATSAGRLIFFNGNRLNTVVAGRTEIQLRTWNHVVLVRRPGQVTVYLNGNREPEIDGEAVVSPAASAAERFIGGRNDNFANVEGKIDEVAFYNRTLGPDEVAAHYQASGMPARRLATKYRAESAPLSPTESLATLRLPPGFRAELVAAEPLVQSPVAIDWGADGRLWVVEMADYPMGMDGKMKPGGRVRFLEDTNGDGRFDQSTVFLTNVNFPNGIITWRKGVLITAAPDIFYAEDTDGDGRADRREVLYTGFKEGNLQLRINGLRWGLDNWLHCANGWSGGTPRSLKTGASVDLSGRDLRLQPDTGALETLSGQSEFGRNRDDWGFSFGCDNSYPLFHFVIDEHYLRRNPHLPAPEVKRQLFTANPKVYAISKGQKRYHSFEHTGHFTSACSSDFYRDELLFQRGPIQHAFVCEPVHNLVQHELVEDDGATFKARPARDLPDRDFLVASDQWFRPVMARTGPDGALWVADMYRYMIEHPDWLPPEGKKEMEPFYRLGEERGRIYRIVRDDRKLRPVPRFDRMSAAELVAGLESPNGWQRDQAHMQLVWRGDNSVAVPLEELAAKSDQPLARLHALGVLDGLGAVRPLVIERALREPHPAVRIHALRLSEALAGSERTSPRDQLLKGLLQLVSDPDPKVRLQLALTLGEWPDAGASDALSRLATAHVDEPYLLAAVLSSAPRHTLELVAGALDASFPVRNALASPLLALSLALSNRQEVADLLAGVLAPETGSSRQEFSAAQLRIAASFLDTVSRRGTSLERLAAAANDGLTTRLRDFDRLFTAARAAAFDELHPMENRVAAVLLTAHDRAAGADTRARLAGLIAPRAPGELQRAAVKALAASRNETVPALLLTNWSALLPDVRASILDALIPRESWALALLRRIEQGDLTMHDLDASRRSRLLKHGAKPVRELAEKLFSSASAGDRQKVLDQFRPALELEGSARAGQPIFVKLCATCHRLGETGPEVGPNLISVRAHSPEKLLTSILDPNRDVEPRYLAYNCTLTGGEELYGLVAAESGSSIGLKLPDGTSRSVLRSEIQALRSTRLSLMPEGLETGLSVQDLANLIEYLRAPEEL